MRYLFTSAVLLLVYAVVGTMTYGKWQTPPTSEQAVEHAGAPETMPRIIPVALPTPELPPVTPPSPAPASLAPTNSLPILSRAPLSKSEARSSADVRPASGASRSADDSFRHPLGVF